MIFITQVIYIVPGQEAVFDQFESVALPAISRYNGTLLFRVRPGAEAYIEAAEEPPYEIHLVRFDSDDDLKQFMVDEERKQFLHLKEASVRSTLLIRGSRI